MIHLSRLWTALRAPWRALRVLLQLPSQVTQWQMTQQESIAVVRETNDLLRELLIAIGQGPQTPETPRRALPLSSESSGPMQVVPPTPPSPPPDPPSPTRLRTARDVTYSSRQFLREQAARVEAAQAPWRTPGA